MAFQINLNFICLKTELKFNETTSLYNKDLVKRSITEFIKSRIITIKNKYYFLNKKLYILFLSIFFLPKSIYAKIPIKWFRYKECTVGTE